MQAVQAFVDGVTSADKTFKRVEEGFHELLVGNERTDMTQGMIDWMRPRVDRPWQQQAEQGQEQEQAVQQQGLVQRVAAAAEGPSGAKL
jgi:hypothetical protein